MIACCPGELKPLRHSRDEFELGADHKDRINYETGNVENDLTGRHPAHASTRKTDVLNPRRRISSDKIITKKFYTFALSTYSSFRSRCRSVQYKVTMQKIREQISCKRVFVWSDGTRCFPVSNLKTISFAVILALFLRTCLRDKA